MAPSPAPSSVAEPSAAEPVVVEGSVQDVIANRDDLSNVAQVLDAWLEASPGRDGVLRNPRGITVFLPNNAGFSEDDAAALLADPDAISAFLSEHLLVGAIRSDELGPAVTTAGGTEYEVGNGPSIGGREIVEADIEATNGLVDIIDGPLGPDAG